MKKKLVLTFILAVTLSSASAQRLEIVAAASNYFKTGTGSVSWTLGELAIETYRSSTVILTQGFQQPRSGFVTAVYEAPFGLSAYPNPTDDAVWLTTDDITGMTYQVLDLTGHVLQEATLTQAETQVSFQGLAPALYLLEVKRGGVLIQIFRIVKK